MIALALRTRDDVETVDACLSFHLNAGVDAVLVVDEGSADGTLEILHAYAGEGVLRLLPRGETRTRMARLAVSKFGADWVLHADGDEFLWPRAADLRELLAVIPARYKVVRALARMFPPQPGDGPFAERRIMRSAPAVPAGDAPPSTRPALRVVHRAAEDVVVEPDGGAVIGLVPLRGWYPIEALRFPGQGRAPEGETPGLLTEDTRLRDALRQLLLPDPAGPRAYALPSEAPRPVVLPLPSLVDDASHALDIAAQSEADIEELRRRVERLEDEVAMQKRGIWLRAQRKAGRLVRRVRR